MKPKVKKTQWKRVAGSRILVNLGKRGIRVSLGVFWARNLPDIRGKGCCEDPRRNYRIWSRRLRCVPRRPQVHLGNKTENQKALQIWLKTVLWTVRLYILFFLILRIRVPDWNLNGCSRSNLVTTSTNSAHIKYIQKTAREANGISAEIWEIKVLWLVR